MVKIINDYGTLLLEAMGQTLLLALCGLFFACILGLIFGLLSVLKSRVCNIISTIFVDVIRGVPMIVLAPILIIYLGFGLKGSDAADVILLQAAVYIAVDMLPLPGAQGITELMYQAVFARVFTPVYLIPSMLVSRGINFYFLLVVSLVTVIAVRIGDKRSRARA